MVVLDPDNISGGVVAQHHVRKALVCGLVRGPLKLQQAHSSVHCESVHCKKGGDIYNQEWFWELVMPRKECSRCIRRRLTCNVRVSLSLLSMFRGT